MKKKIGLVCFVLMLCSFSFGSLSKKVLAGTAGRLYFDQSASFAPSGILLSFCAEDAKGLWKISVYDSDGVPMIWAGHFDYQLDEKKVLTIHLREGELHQKGTEVVSEIKEFFEDYFGSNPILANLSLSLDEDLVHLDEQWVFLGCNIELKDLQSELLPYQLSEHLKIGKIDLVSEKLNFFSGLKYVVLEDMKELPRNSVPFN